MAVNCFGDDILLRRDAEKTATLNTKIQDIYELLNDYGPIPEELTSKLNNEKDINILKKWLKLAAKADSLEEFIKAINE